MSNGLRACAFQCASRTSTTITTRVPPRLVFRHIDAKLSSNGIGAANNSLSRAIFVVQSGFSSSAVYGAAGATGGYLAVRFAEANALLKRQRYSRWIGPAVCACVAGVLGSRIGMYAALDELNARAAYERQDCAALKKARELDT